MMFYPLYVIQQQCPAFMAVQLSSKSIPHLGFPPTSPLRLSLHSQQQSSLWDCFPIPTLQLPITVVSGGLTSLSKAWGHITDYLFDSHSIQIVTDKLLHSLTASTASILSKSIALSSEVCPLLQLPHSQTQVQSHLLSSSFPIISLAHRALYGSICSFPIIRDSCQYSVLCEIFNI